MAVSIAATVAAFMALFVVANHKSYYPYTFTYQSNVPYLSSTQPYELIEFMKGSFTDNHGGVFFVDYVEVDNVVGDLTFKGRYSSPQPASDKEVEPSARHFLATKVSRFMANRLCSFTVQPKSPYDNLEDQIRTVETETGRCWTLVSERFIKTFSSKRFELFEDGRLKKILFMSIIVSLFCGFAIYFLLENVYGAEK